MKKMRKFMGILLAMVMVVAMCVPAFAAAATPDAGTASFKIIIADETDHQGVEVDSGSFEAGQTLYAAINSDLSYYEPDWIKGKDIYNGETTYYLDSFVGYAAYNVDHQYNADGSGWSYDWGWIYLVNGKMPAFADNPQHRMAMNQYTIQPGDEIQIVYAYSYTEWNAAGDTTFHLIYPENLAGEY